MQPAAVSQYLAKRLHSLVWRDADKQLSSLENARMADYLLVPAWQAISWPYFSRLIQHFLWTNRTHCFSGFATHLSPTMDEDSILKKSFGERLLEKMAGLKSKKPPSRDEKYRTTLMNLDDYLAQPEEDSKIGSKLKQLQNYIHAHAKYYHDRPVSLSKEEILALLTKRLFKSDREATWRLAYCIFENPSHRETFIRLIISKAICMGIDFNGNADISLLPKEIVLFMTAFKETPRSKETTQGM
jgi:hypothetical protein